MWRSEPGIYDNISTKVEGLSTGKLFFKAIVSKCHHLSFFFKDARLQHTLSSPGEEKGKDFLGGSAFLNDTYS